MKGREIVNFRRDDIAEFAQMMDSVMHSKEMERELDGSFYTNHLTKVIEEANNQIDDLMSASHAMKRLTTQDLGIADNPTLLLSNVQKRAVHVANYCMMLYGIAQNKAAELDKLSKTKNNKDISIDI